MKSTPYLPIDSRDEKIARVIVDAAYAVHKALGPGLFESVYEPCFCHELGLRGASYERQGMVPLMYKGIRFEESFRLDVRVEGRVICELKSIEQLLPAHLSQVLTYLKLTGHRLGFLLNFNVPIIKQGIKRVIL